MIVQIVISGLSQNIDLDKFGKDVISFGRNPECDIQLNQNCISGLHGCFYMNNRVWYLKDLESSNGIWLNGSRVDDIKLEEKNIFNIYNQSNPGEDVRIYILKTQNKTGIIIGMLAAALLLVVCSGVLLYKSVFSDSGNEMVSEGGYNTEEESEYNNEEKIVENSEGDAEEVTEEAAEDSKDEIKSSVYSDEILVGNPDYIITDIQVSGVQYDSNVNKEVQFNYDYDNREITRTLTGDTFLFSSDFRYDIPAEMNVFSIDTYIDNDFLIDFDIVNLDKKIEKIQKDNNRISEIIFEYDDSIVDGYYSYNDYVIYNDKGNPVEYDHKTPNDSSYFKKWTYDIDDKIIGLSGNWGDYSFSYSDDGQLIKCDSIEYSPHDDFEYETIYGYDNENRLCEITKKNKSTGSIEYHCQAKYDENGNIIETEILKDSTYYGYENLTYKYSYKTKEELKNYQYETDIDNETNIINDEKSNYIITTDQAYNAVKNYCFSENPALKEMYDSGEYYIYWCGDDDIVNGEYRVTYRSYTGSFVFHYVNMLTGDVKTSQLVPGIIDEETTPDYEYNALDYL